MRANTEWHFYNELLHEKLPSSKKQVLQMVERSCDNDRNAQKQNQNISNEDLFLRRRIHFARACGYYLASKGYGKMRP